MAICFELVVNFGDNMEAARAALLAYALRGPRTLTAGDRHIPLHVPSLGSDRPYIEVSVLPVAVGYQVSFDGSIPRIALTAAELTELGNGLYQVLSTFDGYVAAHVGWDNEDMVNPTELRSEWMDELRAGDIDGLVLSDALHAELGLGDNFAVFQPGYQWMPYRGQQRGTLTAD